MQVSELSSSIGGGDVMERIEVEAKAPTVYETVGKLASANAVVVFTISGCCMCHVVKQLLFGLGVAPTVVELDRDVKAGSEIHALFYHLAGGDSPQQPVPTIFIGGKFLGGVETLMACHINGENLVNGIHGGDLVKAAGGGILWRVR